MAGSYLTFQESDQEEVMYFYTSVENIPKWDKLRNGFKDDSDTGTGHTIKETVTCKSGFLAEVDHLFTIGFYYLPKSDELRMGVNFQYTPPTTRTNDNITISVLARAKFCRENASFITSKNVTVLTSYGARPSWNECRLGEFRGCKITPEHLAMPGTNAYLEIQVAKRTEVRFANLQLTRCENPSAVQVFEHNKSGDSLCSSADSNGKKINMLGLTSKYFLSEEFSDAKIVCGDGSIIPVHRVFLTAGCDYFARMFVSDMQEANSGVVKINEFSSGCVKELLRFIYTGATASVSTELFIAADKYGLQELKNHCANQLVKAITLENAVEMYELGRKFGSEVIMGPAKQLVHCNKRKLIKDEDALKEFTSKYPTLMLDLINM